MFWHGKSFRAVNFKSFGAEGFRIPQIKPINLVVGRNNSGKSSLLDVVEFLCGGPAIDATHHHRGQKSSVYVTTLVPSNLARGAFQEGTTGGYINGDHWQLIGTHLTSSHIEIKVLPSGKSEFSELHPSSALLSSKAIIDRSTGIPMPPTSRAEFNKQIASIGSSMGNPLSGAHVSRLSAERDVVPEARDANLGIKRNGSGLTKTIANVIVSAAFNSALVEEDILGILNSIVHPDILFNGIRARELSNQRWEIFLSEKNKGLIPLSSSGSGLKTILLTISLIDLIPKLESKDISNTVFLFEELENNLHPAMQRRLLQYVRTRLGPSSCAFITTHSSALIDMFAHDELAQIIHVSSNEDSATVSVADTHGRRTRILDDLDVRASDLLQSNGIVWVEGPSDRIYFNEWIRLFSDGELQEGTHYQCVFYGGRLLSHLTAAEPDGAESSDLIEIFNVNRNAIILMDSDKKSPSDGINTTKQRIVDEIESAGGIAWITRGREVENYIPEITFTGLSSLISRGIGEFEEIENYLSATTSAEDAKRYLRSKADFAEMICPLLTKEGLALDHRFVDQLATVIKTIRRWNGLLEI